ncbi:MAG TPA: FUSC family protein [bacterium]|nr:FUSC family protein [bacterium]
MPNPWGRFSRLTLKTDWSQWDPLGGLRGMLGVAFPLIAGFAAGRLTDGVIGASGALALGLGSFQKDKQTHPGVLLLGALAMALSTCLGTLTGHWLWLSLGLASLWGFAGGLLFELDLPLSFVGNKAILALLIAGGYPSDFPAALHRSLLVLSGGFVQALLAWAEGSLRVWRGGRPRAWGGAPSFSKTLAPFKANLAFASPLFQGALRLALALGLSDLGSRFLSLQRAYWVPLTVLIILRPEFDQTFGRGLGRLAGTFLGVGFATALSLWLHPHPLVLALFVLLFSWLCFTLFAVNYALFALALTAYVVFMVTLGGMNEEAAARDRLLGTLAGGLFAMLVFGLWPVGRKK